MGIAIKEEILEQKTVSKDMQNIIDMAEVRALVSQEVTVAVGTASQVAMERMDKMVASTMRQVRELLEQQSATKTRVLAVEVNGEKRKLSRPANPNLGRMLVNAKLGLNTLLVGPAGSGKTVAGHQVAESLGLAFGHICLTAGASETWLFGRQTPNGFIEGTFSKLYRDGGVFLADEMDAGDPNLLLAINTALANGTMYNPISGETIAKHSNFVFIGAANTVGRGGDHVYTGRSRLDAATLNRFIIIMVDYCPEIERQACPDDGLRELLQGARVKLRELKSPEIISTRTLEQAYAQFSAGIELGDIVASVTAGWADGLSKQAGLLDLPKPKASKSKAPAPTGEELAAELEKARLENAALKSGKKGDPFQF